MTFNSVTLARTIWLPDDGPRAETCRNVFNVLMCKFYKFYICAVVGIIIEWGGLPYIQIFPPFYIYPVSLQHATPFQ